MNFCITTKHAFLLALICLSFTAKAADPFEGFPEPGADFPAHIVKVEKYLLATQMPQRANADVQYNLPFERKADPAVAYRGRFLLIHGLNDSPYVFTDVASMLVQRGFDVRAILLPGHGNTPKAQLDMSYMRWLNSAREHLRLWQSDNKQPMYLGGFSMGAVIATLLALENEDIEGLLVFSPAYQSSQNHLLRWSGLYSRFKPWVFGGMIIEDNPTKYNSIPINGVAQYYQLTKMLKAKWGRRQLDIPVLAVASVNDSVVDIDHLIKLFKRRFTSAKKRLLIYNNGDTKNGDAENSEASGENESKQSNRDESELDIVYRVSAYPELRILNQSHQSVIMSPSNPLFGQNGTVLVCNGNDWSTFSACLYSDQRHWFGAQHTPSPDNVPVARVTYNPDFAGVFAEFDQLFK